MGKDKSGQRTKGNAKPSSSGRSAELLGGVSGFVGFGGLSDLGYVPAASQTSVDDDTQMSAEFRVTLRKMSKKDAVTKMKALQEFETLCSSEDIDSIKTALPYWPRLYSKLTLDCDRRVRESAQSAQSALVSQIGKSLAPYLRSIMPSWLLAMTDPHTPAATNALKSFQAAFSEEKRPGVMIFCSKEIVDCISENLFVQSAQTLSDAKSVPKEEQENKYLRVLFCSLKGMSLFLETTSKLSDKKEEILAKIIPFIENEKYWKLSKHESTLVRSAWFDNIKALFEFDIETLRKHSKKLSEIIFKALDSPDSVVLPYIWIAFLHLCVGLPECWTLCGSCNSVFNRIFSVLREGGRGHMTEMAPQLLPILSVIPVAVMEDQNAFYIGFFRAISTSLRNEKVLVCKRDVAAIIVALVECLKYMSKEQSNNNTLWETLMKYQVVDLLRSTFVEPTQYSESHLYQEMSKLLLYWATATEANGVTINEDKLAAFWKEFLADCQSWLEGGEEKHIAKLKIFFDIIKDPFSTLAKRSKGVRFDEDKPAPSSSAGSNSSYDPNSNTSMGHREKHLQMTSAFISPFIKKCFDTFKTSKQNAVYSLFSSLLFSFPSDAIYKEMVEHKVEDSQVAKLLFLETSILPLMEEGNNAPVETSINIFLFVYNQLTEEQQRNLLMDLKPNLGISALKVLIEKMTEASDKDSIAALWLRSPPLGGRMLKCLQQLCAITLTNGSLESPIVKEQHECLTDLLMFIFSNGYKERTIFSLEYLNQMLKSLKIMLSKLEPEKGEETCVMNFILFCTRLLNHLLDSPIYSLVEGLDDIWKYFYHLLCNPLPKSSPETLSEVRFCFLKGLELNLSEKLPQGSEALLADESSLLVYVLLETKALLMSDSCSFAKTLELSDLMKKVLLIVFKCSPIEEDVILLLDHSIMQPVLEKVLPTDCEWSRLEETLSPLYVAPAVLYGTFICREFPLPLHCGDTPPWHQGFSRVCLFLVRVILSLCEAAAGPTEGERVTRNVDDGSISLGQFTSLVVFALHGACHSSGLLRMNTFLNNNSVSSDTRIGSEKLAKSMKRLLSLINTGNQKLIVKQLRERSSYGNISWCVTLELVLTSWIKVPISADKLIDGLEESLGYVETKQVLLPYLPERSIVAILMEEVEKVSSLSDDPYSALPSVCFITSALEQLSLSKGDKQIDSQTMEATIHTIFGVLVKWRDAAANIFLFASDLSGVAWEDVSLMVSIIRLLSVIVKGHSIHLLHSHWDVTLCALSAWVQSLVEVSKSPESNTVVAMFTTACTKIAGVVSELLSKLMTDSALKEEYPPTLLEEWQEFFAPSIFNTLLLRFVNCADAYHKRRSVILYSLTRSLSLCVASMKGVTFKEINLPPRFNVEDSESPFKLPDNLQSFLNHVTPFLVSGHPECQSAAFCLVKASLPEVMEAWEKNPSSLNEMEDWPQRPLPHALMSTIQESGSVVEAALNDKEMGSVCEVQPYTDSYSYTGGYLLTWLLTLSAVPHGDENHQQLYASYIRESNLLFNLLDNLFKLMPLKPQLDKKSRSDATMFNTPLTVSVPGKVSSEFISWLACQVYLSCLSQLPAAVRSWWTNLDRNTQQLVDRYTVSHVSPILIASEINTINESNVKYNNMTIKSRLGAREIIAVYTIDEVSMELVLRLAPNHPLSTVTLEDQKRVGVSIAQWRNWLFGLNTMLSHRNTPLLNSLEFWKKNVDQKFEGIEECFICYYVLHGTSHQIPKLLCRTCKKKFHSACLYKWFSTSSNSTCPICRSLF